MTEVFSTSLALVALVVVPLAASLPCFAWPALASRLALAVGAAQLVAAGVVIRTVLREGILTHEVGGWGAPLGIDLHVDGLSALMLMLTVVVMAFIVVYARPYFAHGHGSPSSAHGGPGAHFWPLLMLIWASLNALFVSGDLFNLYVTLELLTFAAVALIGLAGTVASLVAALRYLVIALTGSLFYLLGVALLYSTHGTVSWTLLSQTAGTDSVTLVAFALCTVALALKTALFPLHFWLPAAHANAPAPVSALLSGVVLKASLYMLLRFWFYAFPGAATPSAGTVLGVLGGLAVLWGSMQAIQQKRAKLMLAYSSVAQVGYLFLIFALMWTSTSEMAWKGMAYMALSHAFAKAAAFMAVGTLALSAGGDHLDKLRGIAVREPMATLALGLAALSLMGLPPSGGFIAKWLLLNASMGAAIHWITLILLVGGLLAALYIFKILAVAFLVEGAPSDETHKLAPGLRWAPLLLAVLGVLLGFSATLPMSLLDAGAPVIRAALEAAS